MLNMDFSLDQSLGKQALQSLSTNSGGSLGVVCPDSTLNHDMPPGVVCKACEAAQMLWKRTKSEPHLREVATTVGKKKKPMVVAEFGHERGKLYVLSLPLGVADTILNAIYNPDPNAQWPDIIHPMQGYPLVMKKYKDMKGQVSYSIQPKMSNLTAADLVLGGDVNPATTEATVMRMLQQAAAVDLDRLGVLLDQGQLPLPTFNYSQMQMDSSVVFKIVPNVLNPKNPPLRVVYTHFISKQEVYNGPTAATLTPPSGPAGMPMPGGMPAAGQYGGAPAYYGDGGGNPNFGGYNPPPGGGGLPLPSGLPVPGGAGFAPMDAPAGFAPPAPPAGFGAPAPMAPPAFGTPPAPPAGFAPAPMAPPASPIAGYTPAPLPGAPGMPVETPMTPPPAFGAPAPMAPPAGFAPMTPPPAFGAQPAPLGGMPNMGGGLQDA